MSLYVSKLRIQYFSIIDFSKGTIVCKNMHLPDKGLNRKLNDVQHFVRCLCKHSLAIQPVICRAHCIEEGMGFHELLKTQAAYISQETAVCEQRADLGIHKTPRQYGCFHSFNFLQFWLKFCWVNLGKMNSFLSVLFLLLEVPDWKRKAVLCELKSY